VDKCSPVSVCAHAHTYTDTEGMGKTPVT